MEQVQIEFTDDALVITDKGIQRLGDILHRSVRPSVWTVKWHLRDDTFMLSFHESHKAAVKFAAMQLGPRRVGPARLIEVSDTIYDTVEKYGTCWAILADFEAAETYDGDIKWAIR